MGLFSYWVTLYIPGCESRQGLQASDILGNSPGYLINYSNWLKGCVIFPMSLQGLQDHRNWFINCVCYFSYFWYNFSHFWFSLLHSSIPVRQMLYWISYNTHKLNLNFYICKFTPYMGSLTIHGSLWYLRP